MQVVDFEIFDKNTFLEKYKNVASVKLLTKIWEFANREWKRGYEQGYRNPYSE